MKEKEVFIKEIVSLIEKKLNEAGEKVTIERKKVTKNNGVEFEGIVLISEITNIHPTIYLDSFYEGYQMGKSLEELAEFVISKYKESMTNTMFDTSMITDYEKAKDRIYPKLLNYEKNKELFKGAITKLEDLGITYYIDVENCIEGEASVRVTESLMNLWGISLDELNKLAIENNKKKKYVVVSLAQQIMVMEEMGFSDIHELPIDDVMYVITSESHLYGAAAVLNEEIMKKVIEKVGESIILIPSSIHEFIAISSDNAEDFKYINEIINQVNTEQLADEEVLSEHIYRYTIEKGFESA